MKHTLCIKWLAVCLAALSFAGSVEAVTNDLNAAYKATLERAIGLINTGKTARASRLLSEAVICIEALEKSGDRSLLPYFTEKSLDTANPKTVRENAAAAYVKIANLDESLDFVRELYKNAYDYPGDRNVLNQQLIQKFEAIPKEKIKKETTDALLTFFLEQIQEHRRAYIAAPLDKFLLNQIPDYANSHQRSLLGKTYANKGNQWVTNTFNPIKVHFDNIPPSKRVDLRKRFPDLPPLPEDKNAGPSLKIALAVGAAFVAVCVAIWIWAKRRKRNHADRQLNLR